MTGTLVKSLLVGLCIVAVPSPVLAQPTEAANEENVGFLQPSMAVVGMFDQMRRHPDRPQPENVGTFFDAMIQNDEGLEAFALAEAHFLRFSPRRSAELFERFAAEGDDLVSRHAFGRLMQIYHRAFDQPERTATMMEEHRERFGADPNDINGLFQQTYNFAQTYTDAGEPDRGADMVVEEVGAAGFDAPYLSHRLPVMMLETFRAAGRENEAYALMRSSLAGLAAALEARLVRGPTLEEELVPVPAELRHWFFYSQRLDGYPSVFEARNAQYEAMIERLEATLEAADGNQTG